MTLDPDQLLLDGRTMTEADAPPPKPPCGNARYALEVDGVRTIRELADVWWPPRPWQPVWRRAGVAGLARDRVDALCRAGHVLPPVSGWGLDTVPQRATPEAVSAMLAPVDGSAIVAQIAAAWFGRHDDQGIRDAWRWLQWLRARRLIARLPGAYYPERSGAFVPVRTA